MSTMFNLRGRVAVVTGGNGGIGLAIAEALAQHGCALSIWGRNAGKNAAAMRRVEKFGTPIHAQICDVSVREDAERSTDETLKQFGRIDGCFANAGIGGGGRNSFIERTDADWRSMFAVNLDGVFHAFQPIVRHMVYRASQADPFGRLVATSSMAALFGTARNEHYAASKSAVNSFIQGLAVEHARYGITANAILPGWTATKMTEGLQNDKRFMDAAVPRIPMRRFAEPSDFGGIAVYLMSNASSYHTADCILIDGGYRAF